MIKKTEERRKGLGERTNTFRNVGRAIVGKFLCVDFIRPVETVTELVERDSPDCTKEYIGNGTVYQRKN